MTYQQTHELLYLRDDLRLRPIDGFRSREGVELTRWYPEVCIGGDWTPIDFVPTRRHGFEGRVDVLEAMVDAGAGYREFKLTHPNTETP